MENVIAYMIHRKELDENEKFNQSFCRLSRYDIFMQILVEKIVYKQGFITPAAAFVKQRMNNAIEEKLRQEPRMTKVIL